MLNKIQEEIQSNLGCSPDNLILDGTFQRFGDQGSSSTKKPCWYIGEQYGSHICTTYGDFRNDNKFTYSSNSSDPKLKEALIKQRELAKKEKNKVLNGTKGVGSEKTYLINSKPANRSKKIK